MALAQLLPEMCDDTTLLTRIRRGDEQAMASFYDRYATIVYSVALHVLHHAARAEEILEEVFGEVWRAPERLLTASGSLGASLALMARQCAVDALLRRPSSPIVYDLSLAAVYDLSNEAERLTLTEKTCSTLSLLPRDQKKTFEMAFFDGLSPTEIAEITGSSEPIVKAMIRDTLFAIRKAALA